jgi:hypothetical protein
MVRNASGVGLLPGARKNVTADLVLKRLLPGDNRIILLVDL